MKDKETDIDSMKYRKSTHLAGIDVEAIVENKGKCILTIKEVYYAKDVDVSGKKTDGYFIDFVEGVKPMKVNSGNRTRIGNMFKKKTKCSSLESRKIKNWAGLKIELTFDPTVKMMGKVVGGIVVPETNPIPDISDKNALGILNGSLSAEELKANWSKLSKDEQSLPTVVAKKDSLKKSF
jgi:hypothetical protein